MNVTGIIAEYNPMHNGHICQLAKARLTGKADFTVAVMSGNFTQRGEPALCDKWTRAGMAVEAGVDLVLELPFVYATGSAEYFAEGAVAVMRGLGVVTHLCFGSEAGDTGPLKELADILIAEPPEYREELRKQLENGVSFPKARQEAVQKLTKYADLLKQPNNILAVEYLKAIGHNNDIIPITVKRTDAAHGDTSSESNEFASGAAVRKAIIEGRPEDAARFVPETTASVIASDDFRPADPNDPGFYALIRSEILRRKPEELASIFGAEEGIENRLLKYIRKAGTLEELISSVGTKRYTDTGMRRLLLHILMGFQKCDLHACTPYARILGFNENGAKLLKYIKENETASIPVITKIGRGADENEMARLDIEASDMYSLAFGSNIYKESDFVKKPYIK